MQARTRGRRDWTPAWRCCGTRASRPVTPPQQWPGPASSCSSSPQGCAQENVNDADGNPIEIAALVAWQVQDTAKAIFAVDELHQVRGHPDRDRGPATRLQLPL